MHLLLLFTRRKPPVAKEKFWPLCQWRMFFFFADMGADSIANTKLRNVRIQYSKKLNAGDRSRMKAREKGENENDGEKEWGHFEGKEPSPHQKKKKRHPILYTQSAYHHFNVSLCHTISHQWQLLANVPCLCIVFTRRLLKTIC